MSFAVDHILFPTDFSAVADKALSFALELASRRNARLTIMHVIEEPYDFAPRIENFKQEVYTKVEKLLKEQVRDIANSSDYGQVPVSYQIVYGPPVRTILDAIHELEPELVVMGTTGASGLSRVLFGSNTTEVILESPVPVLAIPQHCTFSGLPLITFLTDYHEEDIPALRKVGDLAASFGSRIHGLHIEKKLNLRVELLHRGFKQVAKQQLEQEEPHVELVIADHLLSGIADYLTMHRSALLVMVRYKKPFFSGLLHKNHSAELGYYSKVPLLILPAQVEADNL